MPAAHGKDAVVYIWMQVAKVNLQSFTSSSETDMTETSAFGDQIKEYVAGLRDGRMSGEGLFEPNYPLDGVLHDAAIGTDRNWMVYPQGDFVGASGHAMFGTLAAYNIDSSFDDAVKVSFEVQNQEGVDRVVSLAGLAARTSTANGTSIDNGAQTLEGGVGYLVVNAGSGGTLVAKVQDSADNSVFADILTFATTTTFFNERKEISGTVRRYVRGQWTLTGGAPSFTFHIGFARNS